MNAPTAVGNSMRLIPLVKLILPKKMAIPLVKLILPKKMAIPSQDFFMKVTRTRLTPVMMFHWPSYISRHNKFYLL